MQTFRKGLPAASAGIAVAVLVGVLSACSGGNASSVPSADASSGVASSAASGTITTAIDDDPASFDPALAQGGENFQMDSLLYDTLLRKDTGNTLVGGLASNWQAKSPSDYVFTIRTGATCADGTPITATVVANSLKHLASPTTDSTWRDLVFGAGTPTITADDTTRTVTIKLSEPFTALESALSVPQTGIICPAGLADLKGLEQGTVPGAFSGPYTLTKSQPGIEYTYTFRNGYDAWPHFSTPLTGHPAETIVFDVATDESTVANQVLDGDVQFAQFESEGAQERFKALTSDYNVNNVSQYAIYLVFNQRSGHVFANEPALRKAVAELLDQSYVNTIFDNGTGSLIQSLQSSSAFACTLNDSSLLTKYDPGAAKKVLSGLTVHYFGESYTGFDALNDYIDAQLTAAGAKVDSNIVDTTAYWSDLATGQGDWDIALIGDLNSTDSISASIDRVTGPAVEAGGRNYSGASNVTAYNDLTAALSTTNEGKQCADYESAQKSLLQQEDIVPLIAVPVQYVSAKDVTVHVDGNYVDYATLRFTN